MASDRRLASIGASPLVPRILRPPALRVRRSLRSSLPMNLKAHFPGFKVWSRAQADIDRIVHIWTECLSAYGGPFLFGERSMADAMYAPVVTRFRTYDVSLSGPCGAYCQRIIDLPEMREWTEAARSEPDAIEEFEVEF